MMIHSVDIAFLFMYFKRLRLEREQIRQILLDLEQLTSDTSFKLENMYPAFDLHEIEDDECVEFENEKFLCLLKHCKLNSRVCEAQQVELKPFVYCSNV